MQDESASQLNANLNLQVGGKWLGWWVVAAAAVSQIGQFEAEMSSDAFQLLGMAERGFLPAALAKRSKHDTPTLAICCSSIGILMLVTFNFSQVKLDAQHVFELRGIACMRWQVSCLAV